MRIDLKKYALKLLKAAKQNLRRDKCLIPVAFVVTDDQILDFDLQFEDAEQKASVYEGLVDFAKKTMRKQLSRLMMPTLVSQVH